ncbi:MAG TPA: ATP-binding cassette domain-containing protein, partial [Candidatus Hodarchaeales archaeon]|nr:ATP-binding cassette domain-containing protein [Candidatus Hodarchaeales archaeon]
AILGPTGSGKTSLLKLLTRFHSPTSGHILVDGIPVENISLENLRAQIGVVEQEVFIFSASIRENIAFSRDNVPEDEIISAARAAQAHEFILATSNGYSTIVGERGMTLSGGQRQRIGIARAFLSNPQILVLDDSSSSLDASTENELALAVDRIQRNRTTFIISHRLATIRRASKIILLSDDGKVVDIGTHSELLQRCQEYMKIFRIPTVTNEIQESKSRSAKARAPTQG